MRVPARALLLYFCALGARAIDDGEDCAEDGTDYEYSEAIVANLREISTNHCPNHPFFNLNPHTAIATATGYQLPAYPMYSAGQQTDLSETGGGTGVTIDGGIIYSGYGGPTYGRMTGYETSAPYVEGDTFDQCGGHSSSDTEPSYHYHVPPVCLLRQLGAAEGAPSPQVGWMLDGFPIYGPLGPGGAAMKTCTVTGGTFGVDDCTDDCGGFYGDTGDGFMYRYYFLGEYNDGACCTAPIDPQDGGGADYYPFTPACMSGCCPSGAWCSFGLPVCDGDAIDGTTASFSPMAIGALATNTEACANDDVCCDFDVNSETCKVVTGSSTGTSCGACMGTRATVGPRGGGDSRG